ncbi:hypothetical protein [Haloarcula sp. 1CSR25-25]|nr:hypothetical protein [Haloarcula sp. 1CSR25-25]
MNRHVHSSLGILVPVHQLDDFHTCHEVGITRRRSCSLTTTT